MTRGTGRIGRSSGTTISSGSPPVPAAGIWCVPMRRGRAAASRGTPYGTPSCPPARPRGSSGGAVMDAYGAIDEWKRARGERGVNKVPDRVQDYQVEGKEADDMGVMTVSVNREGNRLLLLPYVECWGVDRLTDRFFASLKGPGMTAGDIGGAVLDAFAFIERTGQLELSLEERRNSWRHDTRYRTHRAFVRNNDFVRVSTSPGCRYLVCAYAPRSGGGEPGDSVWHAIVPAGASAGELGRGSDGRVRGHRRVEEGARPAGRRA